MDAFFASVEQLTRPTLADRPVLVGGLGPRGVVAGASYQARVFGARSAMPMGQARRRCPHATVLPPRFALYQALSHEVMDVLRAASPVFEPVSVDEAFLEPPELAGADAATVAAFATELRRAVRERTGLPASVGAGSGKQLAKIASELAKPDGSRVIPAAEQDAVLGPLPVRSLWGIGPVSGEALRKVGIDTIGKLAATDAREVVGLLGSAMGSELHRLARGVDDRPVAPRGAAKQISAETTFDTDLTAMTAVHTAVEKITAAVHRRLLADGRAARTVTVKARTADFTTTTRSETTAFASRELSTLSAMARRLADTAVGEGGVRLLGVSVSGFSDALPLALFDAVPSAQGWTAAPLGGADEAAPPAGGDEAAPAGPQGADADEFGADGPEVHAVTTEDGAVLLGAGPTRPGSEEAPDPERPWRAGDDVQHAERGHGWVQGSGHGRVTVRFETRVSGPGPARTMDAADPALTRAEPLLSWRPRSAGQEPGVPDGQSETPAQH
ncbi:DNA polymerase IV [Pseudonocardia sp. KRD-291]|nr:DNA polymerase IV [Pseudonocardia sp. KRD291]